MDNYRVRVQNHWSTCVLLPWSVQCVWFHCHYAKCNWSDPGEFVAFLCLADFVARCSCVPYLPRVEGDQGCQGNPSFDDYTDGFNPCLVEHCCSTVLGNGYFLDFGHVLVYARQATWCAEQYGQFWNLPQFNAAPIPIDDICWLERCTGALDEWGNTFF